MVCDNGCLFEIIWWNLHYLLWPSVPYLRQKSETRLSECFVMATTFGPNVFGISRYKGNRPNDYCFQRFRQDDLRTAFIVILNDTCSNLQTRLLKYCSVVTIHDDHLDCHVHGIHIWQCLFEVCLEKALTLECERNVLKECVVFVARSILRESEWAISFTQAGESNREVWRQGRGI